MALDPPVTLPLGTAISGARSVALATYCQLWMLDANATGWPPGVRIGGVPMPVS